MKTSLNPPLSSFSRTPRCYREHPKRYLQCSKNRPFNLNTMFCSGSFTYEKFGGAEIVFFVQISRRFNLFLVAKTFFAKYYRWICRVVLLKKFLLQKWKVLLNMRSKIIKNIRDFPEEFNIPTICFNLLFDSIGKYFSNHFHFWPSVWRAWNICHFCNRISVLHPHLISPTIHQSKTVFLSFTPLFRIGNNRSNL